MSQFKPMLASPMELTRLKYPLVASPKLDGVRAIVRNGVVMSRSLKPIPNKHVQSLFSNYEYFDGELISGSPTASNCYNKTVGDVMRIEGTPDVTFYVFDHIQQLNQPYLVRHQTVLGDLSSLYSSPSNIILLEHSLVNTEQELLAVEAEYLERGYEGAMARNPISPYKCGRATAKSNDLMKIKREEDSEATIISVYEQMDNQNEKVVNELGRSSRSSKQENLVPAGTLGGFTVLWNDVTFNCSCGVLDHNERKALWDIRDSLHGKLLKFRYFGYGAKPNEDGQIVPRFPRALGLRHPIDM